MVLNHAKRYSTYLVINLLMSYALASCPGPLVVRQEMTRTTQYQKNKQPDKKMGKRPKQTFL